MRLTGGPSWFGPAYCAMMARDVHAPGSVDRVLLDSAVGLCRDTARHLYHDYSPTRVRHTDGSRPALETLSRRLDVNSADPEGSVKSVVKFTLGLEPRRRVGLARMKFGGTEEQIIERGSDWCTDVSRVAVALLQVGGIPSRLVYLADVRRAYSAHAVVEAYRFGRWGVADPVSGAVYRTARGFPASAWYLTRNSNQVSAAYGSRLAARERKGEFRRAAIANYSISQRESYDYSVSGISGYYRSVLEMADRGWPGGRRWLHGEGGAE